MTLRMIICHTQAIGSSSLGVPDFVELAAPFGIWKTAAHLNNMAIVEGMSHSVSTMGPESNHKTLGGSTKF